MTSSLNVSHPRATKVMDDEERKEKKDEEKGQKEKTMEKDIKSKEGKTDDMGKKIYE